MWTRLVEAHAKVEEPGGSDLCGEWQKVEFNRAERCGAWDWKVGEHLGRHDAALVVENEAWP